MGKLGTIIAILALILGVIGGWYFKPVPKSETTTIIDTVRVPVTVAQGSAPVVLGKIDSSALIELRDSVANKDSLIAELLRERSADVSFIAYYKPPIEDVDWLPVTGRVFVIDCIANGQMNIDVLIDSIPYVIPRDTTFITITKTETTPLTTYIAIGAAGIVTGVLVGVVASK